MKGISREGIQGRRESRHCLGGRRIEAIWIAKSTLWPGTDPGRQLWAWTATAAKEGVSNGLAVVGRLDCGRGSIALDLHSAGVGGGVSKNQRPSVASVFARVPAEGVQLQRCRALPWCGASCGLCLTDQLVERIDAMASPAALKAGQCCVDPERRRAAIIPWRRWSLFRSRRGEVRSEGENGRARRHFSLSFVDPAMPDQRNRPAASHCKNQQAVGALLRRRREPGGQTADRETLAGGRRQ